jgi:hypothetical protein
MWIQCCIILHNLVLQIEAEKDHREWQEELYLWDQREGAEHRCWEEEAEPESENDNLTELECARRHLMTDGQKFQRRLMKKLFDSETSGAVCHG